MSSGKEQKNTFTIFHNSMGDREFLIDLEPSFNIDPADGSITTENGNETLDVDDLFDLNVPSGTIIQYEIVVRPISRKKVSFRVELEDVNENVENE